MIDLKTVQNIATLSRLSLSEEELVVMQSEMKAVLSWMQCLNKVDTSKVAKTTTGVTSTLDLHYKRELSGDLNASEVLKNAPEQKKRYIRVPKIIE